MNLEIFYDELYYNKLRSFMLIYECKPIFPFQEFHIDPDNLIQDGDDCTAIYNLLNSIHYIYHGDQIYIGYLEIEGITYIVQVDDDLTVGVIGVNEVDWTYILLEREDHLAFKKFCEENYKKEYPEADYDQLAIIRDKYTTV